VGQAGWRGRTAPPHGPRARLKEWAYAGFAITLVSALVAHLAVGDGVEAWSWPVGTGVLWGASYFFFRRLQAGAAAI
jgi:hypothetical protein